MLSTDSNPACSRAESLRDYAFDELSQDERRAMEQHLATCGACATELDRLQVTSAALRTLPDREIPQRIAFVSDRVFEPSAWRRFWNSGARLGFASACVLAAALVVSVWHYRPAAEVHTVVQTASASPEQGFQDQIRAAVARAVAQVRAEDAQMIQAAVQESSRKRDAEYRNQMIVIEDNFERLRKRQNLGYAAMASNDLTASGAGQ
jgi:anti-sigma factor RsiW